MTPMKPESRSFRDFYENDDNVSPAERAKIEFEVEFIGKLIEAREKKGLTQEQLAKAAGLNQSAIARLESLKVTPQIDTLFKVLTPMGYTLAIVPEKYKAAGKPGTNMPTKNKGKGKGKRLAATH